MCCGITRISALLHRRRKSASSRVLIVKDLIHGKAALGYNVFERSTLVVLEPFPGLRDSLFFLLSNLLVFHGSVGESAGNRIEYALKQATDCAELRRWKPVEISMSLLPFVS